jgi:hypothetical protein
MMRQDTIHPDRDDERRRWRFWYAMVLGWHLLVILAMTLFTLVFHPN